MRRLVFILLLLVLLCGIVSGCRVGSVGRRLVEIDTLIAHGDFDSALTQLRAVDTTALSCDDRAYHALLMVHAAYKAYDSAYLDTVWIARARTAYADGGPYDRHIRAMLYSGCVAEDLGDPLTAIRWYKKTELEARADDHYRRGFAQMTMGAIFQNYYAHFWAIANFRNAINEFKLGNEPDLRLYCLNCLGKLYQVSNPDSSYHFLHIAEEEAQACGNNEAYLMANSYLAGYYNRQHRYHEALSHAKRAFDQSKDQVVVFEAIHMACEAACELGMLDSAVRVMERSTEPTTPREQVMHLLAMSKIEKLKNSRQKEQELKKAGEDLSEKLSFNNQKDILIDCFHETENEVMQMHVKRNRLIYVISISAALGLIAAVLVLWFMAKKKRKSAEDNVKELSDINEDINGQLALLKRELEALKERRSEDEAANSTILGLQASLISMLLNIYTQYKDKPEQLSQALSKSLTSKSRVMEKMSEYADMSASDVITTLKNRYPNMSEKDMSIVVMSACGCSYDTIALAMEYTNAKSVQNRLRIMPKEVMGINVTVQQLIDGFKQYGPDFLTMQESRLF